MYNVLLVDDEPWALVSTKNSFCWEKYHLEVSAETSNPYEAIEILENQKIHAAFVDIRMPGISGLELVRTIKAKGVDTEFIITSGYAEFSYAQEALREGVFDYCLKPIQPEITEQLLNRLSLHLESKQIEKDLELYDKLAKNRYDNAALLAEEHFTTLYPFFQIADIHYPEIIRNKPGFKLSGQTNLYELCLGRHRMVYIINSAERIDTQLLDGLSCSIDSPELHAGISSSGINASDLARLIREAEIAANRYFVNGKARVNLYSAPDLSVVNDSVDKIFRNFDAYSADNLNQILCRAPEHFIENNLGFEEAVCYWNQIKAEILKLDCDPMLLRELELIVPEDFTYRFGCMEDMCCYLADILCMIKKKDLFEADTSGVNDSFLKLLEHIRKNYASDLYLKDLANNFHINFTYCCDLFKKFTAMTFSQFLTEIRMSKAQELLSETRMPIEEIGSSVGFHDYHYFISVFKKHTKLTPSQFRNEKLNSDRLGM